MKYAMFLSIVCMMYPSLWTQGISQTKKTSAFHLIAHRGGVVDSSIEENSMRALQRAFKRGYWMVEIDVRTTKDGVLITSHDASLKRQFGADKLVTDMTWEEINKLHNCIDNKVLKLEEVLAYCSGKLQVMIDNKIKGNDTALFNRLLQLLKKYNLQKEALMIGTDESTEFFTGKIKLSCTRRQLEENKKRSDYSAANYYLFGSDISKEDVTWAKDNGIMAIGVLNAWALSSVDRNKQALKAAKALINTGAPYFQIDSQFEEYFR